MQESHYKRTEIPSHLYQAKKLTAKINITPFTEIKDKTATVTNQVTYWPLVDIADLIEKSSELEEIDISLNQYLDHHLLKVPKLNILKSAIEKNDKLIKIKLYTGFLGDEPKPENKEQEKDNSDSQLFSVISDLLQWAYFYEVRNRIKSGLSIESFTRINTNYLLQYKDNIYTNLFLLAVRRCDISTVISLVTYIQKNTTDAVFQAFIHTVDNYGRNALMLAAIAGNRELLAYLHTELNFDLNKRDRANTSTLGYTIDRNQTHAFEYLLFKGSHFTDNEWQAIIRNKNFYTYFNSPDCFLSIVESGNINAWHYIFRTVKGLAPESQQAYLTILNNQGQNAFILAAAKKHFHLISSLQQLNFDLHVIDHQGKKVFHYLAENHQWNLLFNLFINSLRVNTLTADEIELFKAHLPQFDTIPGSMKNTVADTITVPTNTDQSGRLPRLYPIEQPRPYRSFSSERERQLLRQVATQLFYAFISNTDIKKSGLKEVQLMHLEFAGRHHIFIAVNEFNSSKHLMGFIKDLNNFRNLLFTQRFPERDEEGRTRSQRYARKLYNRIIPLNPNFIPFSNSVDEQRAQAVSQLIRTGQIQKLVLDYGHRLNRFTDSTKQNLAQIFNQNENSIYVLRITNCMTKYEQRHAEEFLTDIAEYALTLAASENQTLYSCIGGKKRPCMGCSGRMDGVITQFGSYPGRFWKHSLENQSDQAAARTMKKVCGSPSNASMSKMGNLTLTDYDSGSDSDPEENTILLNLPHGV